MRRAAAIVLLALAGCDRRPAPTIVFADLKGVPAYTGQWHVSGGGPEMDWSRPVYGGGIAMNPPIRVSWDFDSAMIRRTIGYDQFVEVDGKPLASGQIEGFSYLPGGGIELSGRMIAIGGTTYSSRVGDVSITFTPDRTRWLMTHRDKDGSVVISVDGAERARLKSGDARSFPNWTKSASGWNVVIADTNDVDSAWRTLDGKPASGPVGQTRAMSPMPAGEVRIARNNNGPQTLAVNGRTIGTFAYIANSNEPLPPSAGLGYNKRAFGSEPDGTLVFYVVDGGGRLVRLRVPK